MDIEQMQKLIDLAKANGLKSISTAAISFQFYDDPPKLEAEGSLPENNGEKIPDDDEMLYASTPYFDQLRAERQGAE